MSRKLVFLTGFEPFAGRKKNNSFEIARELLENPQLIGPDVKVEICELPVVYDRASDIAERCYEAMGEKPDVVVSMGEGSCNFRLETAATNLDNSGAADNSGEIRRDSVINADLPARVGMSLPVDQIFCERPKSRPPIEPSVSPGAYVCNNTAFHLAHYFNERKTPFGFIHVPASDCKMPGHEARPSVHALAKTMARMIGTALKTPPLTAPWPTDRKGVEALLERASQTGVAECNQDFIRSLIRLYHPSQRKKPFHPELGF